MIVTIQNDNAWHSLSLDSGTYTLQLISPSPINYRFSTSASPESTLDGNEFNGKAIVKFKATGDESLLVDAPLVEEAQFIIQEVH